MSLVKLFLKSTSKEAYSSHLRSFEDLNKIFTKDQSYGIPLKNFKFL